MQGIDKELRTYSFKHFDFLHLQRLQASPSPPFSSLCLKMQVSLSNTPTQKGNTQYIGKGKFMYKSLYK